MELFVHCRRLWQGVYSVRNAHYTLLVRVDKASLQWSDVATLIDPDFRNMHKRDAVISELKRQKVRVCALGARFLRWFLPYI